MPNFNFWVQDQKLWNGSPKDCKIFEFISDFRFKSCGMDTPWLEKFLNSFLSSGSNAVEWTPWAWKKIKFISEFRSKVVEWTPKILQNFWIHFWVQDQKLWNRLPHDWKIFEFIFEFRFKRCGNGPSSGLEKFLSPFPKGLWNGPPSSDIWWKSWKFYFCIYCPMMHANLP